MQAFALAAGLMALLTGIVVLAGWALDVPQLKSVAPDWPTMKPNAALCFLLTGASLVLQMPGTIGRRRIGLILSVAVVTIGAVTLAEYATGRSLGLDQMLFRDATRAIPGGVPGRMAASTALTFVLLGLSLLLLDLPLGNRRGISSIALLPATIAFVLLLSYLYGAREVERSSSAMPVHSAIVFVVVSLGILCARPERGLAATVASPYVGGTLARHALPLAVAAPIAAGFIRLTAQRTGHVSTEFGIAILIVAMVAIAWTSILVGAARLNVSDEAGRASDRRYRELFERATFGVYQTSLDGKIIAVNAAAAHLFGYGGPEELIQENPDVRGRYADPRDRDRFVQHLLREGTVEVFDVAIRRSDGSVRWVQDNARLLRDADGAPFGIEGILVDITARMQTEHALREAVAHEQEAAGQVRAIAEMKSSIVTAISHEFRTPLTSILGFAQTLIDHGADVPLDEQKEMLRRIASNGERLAQLVRDLLDVQQLTSGEATAVREPTDLAWLISSELAHIDTSSHRLELNLAPGIVMPVDRDRIGRILIKLVTNSIRYTPPNSPIEISLVADNGGALIAVGDRGPGVPDEHKRAVFEAFDHGTGASRHAPGAGLGLFIVAGIARLHGGRAWVEDRPGGGASFNVWLPGPAED